MTNDWQHYSVQQYIQYTQYSCRPNLKSGVRWNRIICKVNVMCLYKDAWVSSMQYCLQPTKLKGVHCNLTTLTWVTVSSSANTSTSLFHLKCKPKLYNARIIAGINWAFELFLTTVFFTAHLAKLTLALPGTVANKHRYPLNKTSIRPKSHRLVMTTKLKQMFNSSVVVEELKLADIALAMLTGSVSVSRLRSHRKNH